MVKKKKKNIANNMVTKIYLFWFVLNIFLYSYCILTIFYLKKKIEKKYIKYEIINTIYSSKLFKLKILLPLLMMFNCQYPFVKNLFNRLN